MDLSGLDNTGPAFDREVPVVNPMAKNQTKKSSETLMIGLDRVVLAIVSTIVINLRMAGWIIEQGKKGGRGVRRCGRALKVVLAVSDLALPQHAR